ncbi:MAG: hypothetical protein ACE5JS_13285 [Nitrospinota bacterium]
MKRKALWVLIGVFLLGMGSGVVVDRAFLGGRGWGFWWWKGSVERRQARVLKYLSWKLDLSEKQKAEIAPILKETWGELFSLRKDLGQRIDQILSRTGERVRPILTGDQAEKFDRIVRKFRAKRGRWRGRRRWRDPTN